MPDPNPAPAGPKRPNSRLAAPVMALCGQARSEELRRALTQLGATDTVEDLRPPETGLVMTRGRIGGDGRPFNLGEATVTRAAVRLPAARPASPTSSAATARRRGSPRPSTRCGRSRRGVRRSRRR